MKASSSLLVWVACAAAALAAIVGCARAGYWDVLGFLVIACSVLTLEAFHADRSRSPSA